ASRAGRILQCSVRPGDTAQAGTVMFTIARDGLVDLDAELPEGRVGGLRIGTPATVETADGTHFAGHVRLIGARVDPQSGAVKVRIALPVSPVLRPGGFAKATFSSLSGTVPVVPESAIRYGAQGASVQVVDRDDRVRSVPVRTGTRADGQVALIDGPPAGTRVVLSGGAFLSDGDTVRPVAAKTAQ
ncbi:MAG TPA: efflux RND transporter periplasmic adaptor subunit, partial [Afipia sp.]